VKYTLFCLIFLSFSIQARLFLDVSVINKKGIDIGLTLGSELHSVEEVREDNSITLTMKSGIRVELNAHFLEEKSNTSSTYGPNPEILVTGKIFDDKGAILKNFESEALKVKLEEIVNIAYSQNAQLVEVRIKPYLK
jgi:hypothetical protein